MFVFRFIRLLLAIVTTVLVTEIDTEKERQRFAPAPRPVMRIIIGPAADAIFQSVSVRQTPTGEVEVSPASAEAWSALEVRAASLAEGANLLLVSRHVVPPDRLIHLDRDRWNQYATALRDAAVWALEAARARSAPRLISAGGDISLACERCHLAFRTPGGRRHLQNDIE